MADMTAQQGMLTPPLICPGVHVCPSLNFPFYEIEHCLLYSPIHILITEKMWKVLAWPWTGDDFREDHNPTSSREAICILCCTNVENY